MFERDLKAMTTGQTGHDMLEGDLKVMKDNYDKICSEN